MPTTTATYCVSPTLYVMRLDAVDELAFSKIGTDIKHCLAHICADTLTIYYRLVFLHCCDILYQVKLCCPLILVKGDSTHGPL